LVQAEGSKRGFVEGVLDWVRIVMRVDGDGEWLRNIAVWEYPKGWTGERSEV
jgi:hypothetical protein